MNFDLIVIGGGTAGCVLANRLSENGKHSVLLLEGGRSDKHPFTRIPVANVMAVQNPEFDRCYRLEPDPSRGGREEHWAAARVLGGGSAINGMMFIRGHRGDYDRWAQQGATGWDYQGVLPYFRRAEHNTRGGDDYRGANGPQSVDDARIEHPLTAAWIAAAQEAGIPRAADLNGELAEGVDRVQVSQRKGWRHTTAAAHIWPAKNRANLKLELQAEVTRILFKDGRAVGVEYRQHGQTLRAEARRGVVLSAGAMTTPKLLMLSGIGPQAHLREFGIEVVADLPGVGANLQDHAGVHLVAEVDQPTLNAPRTALGGIGQALSFFLRGRGALTSSIGHAQAFVRTRPDLAQPNIQIIMLPMAFELDAKGAIKLCDAPSISQMVAANHPRSRGSIRLRSASAEDKPRIQLSLLGDEQDVTDLAEGLTLARRIFEQPALRRHITREVRPGSAAVGQEALKAYVHNAGMCMYHPSGTCKMGQDEMSVVDPQLRVRGVAGLWVADASVMPSITAGNINATVLMIGEKAADLIEAELAKT